MSLKVIGDYCLVIGEEDRKTEFGLVLPSENNLRGRLIDAPQGVSGLIGKLVYFKTCQKVKIDGQEYMLVKKEDVYAYESA